MSYPLVQLGDVATLQAGIGFPPKLQGKASGDYPFAKVGDISRNGRVSRSMINVDNYIDASDLNSLKAKVIPVGGILFAKIGEAIRQNHRVISTQEMLIDNNAMAAIPTNKINTLFLYYFLKTIDFYRLAPATTVPALRKSDLEKVQIPLPPLEEQRRIAEILDKADSLIQKRKESIAKLDELLQATFIDMFGDQIALAENWNKKQLGHCIDIESKQIDATIEPYKNMIHIGGANIEANSGKLINFMTADEENILSNKSLFSADHILYSRIRPYLNKVAAPEFIGICSTDIFPIKIKKPITTKEFILILLRSNSFVKYADLFSKGANIPRLNRNELLDFEFYLPPLHLQQKWATIFQKFEEQKNKMQAQLETQETLFKALQQQAFSGQL